MIRINLLAADREKQPRKAASLGFDIGQKVTLVCSLILVATALGIGWWWWMLDRESARLTSDIAAAERETARLKTILTQVAQFESQKQQLQQRVSLIEELRKGQTGPVHLVENSGSDTFATLKIGDRNVVARFPGRVAVDHHKDLGVDLDLSQVSYFDTKTGLRIV